jgi:lipopolysaccharide/colanic/teichoic acid biosynthesis glycosyltransferase
MAITFEETDVVTYFRKKERLLRPIGSSLFVCSLPILLPLMLLVRITSSGPALYRQRRIGKNGREFVLFKLRTMYNGAEKLTGPIWCRPNDARITPFGKVLRGLHLDELPQLLNVARGEMDLVGPRPERPEIVEDLVCEIPGYAERTSVLPGITGLAQVNLPADTTMESVRRKIILDREYIRTASLGLDVRMVICTVMRMFGIRNGRAVRWLGLERVVPAETAEVPKPAPSSNGRAESSPSGMLWLSDGSLGNGSDPTTAAESPHGVPEHIPSSPAAVDWQSAAMEAIRKDARETPRWHKPK